MSPDLPQQLLQLANPAAEAKLPDPQSLVGPLCNKQLDLLVGMLSRHNKTWQRGLLLHEWLLSAGHSYDKRLCTSLMRLCAQHGQHFQALQLYDWMKASTSVGGAGLSPDKYTYTVVMRAALDAGMLSAASDIWHAMLRARVEPDSHLTCAYVEVCLKQRRCKEAMAAFTELKKRRAASLSVHAYTIGMRAATASGQAGAALQLWDEMVSQQDVHPSGHAYSAAITACAALHDAERAQRLFDEMLCSGTRPDVVSCTSLMSALATHGQWPRCEHIITLMRKWDIAPNARTYCALIAAYSGARQWRLALDLVLQMGSASWTGPRPNAYAYSAVLKCLGDCGQYELAETVFAQLEAAECPASAHHLPRFRAQGSFGPRRPPQPAVAAEAVDGQGVAERSSFADGDSAQRSEVPFSLFSGVEPGTEAGGGVARPESSACGTSGDWSPLTGTVRRSSSGGGSQGSGRSGEESRWGVPQSWSHWGGAHGRDDGRAQPRDDRTPARAQPDTLNDDAALMQRPDPAPVRLQQLQSADWVLSDVEAEDLIEELTLPGVPVQSRRSDSCVNEVVCGALMLAYERAGLWREAIAVMGRARLLGMVPNTIMHNMAVRAAGKAGQVQVAQLLVDRVTDADVVTYETLMAVYAYAGKPREAERVLRTMLDAGHRLRDYAFVALVNAYEANGQWRAALAVQQRMAAAGVSQTIHSMNALIAVCEKHGQYEKALELFRSMRQLGIAPNAQTQQSLLCLSESEVSSIESQQYTAAALSAAAAAVGGVLIRSGMF